MQRRTLLKSIALLPLFSHQQLFASTSKYDVVIIGAGLAGLNAARQCIDYGMRCLVLEASTEAGGRIKSLNQIAGCPEVGGMQIGKGYGLTRMLAQRHQLALKPPTQFVRGQALFINQQWMDAKAWSQSTANLLAGAERDIVPAGLLSHYLKKGPQFSAEQWLLPEQLALDIPLKEYLLTHGASLEALRLIEHIFNGLSIDEHSALEILKSQYARKGSAPGFDMIDGGNQQLPQLMANDIHNNIRYEHAVTRVSEKNGYYEICCQAGQCYQAKHVVIATPCKPLKNIHLNVSLTPQKRFALEHLGYTPITQVVLQAKGELLLEDGFSPNIWSDSPIERIFALKNASQQITTLLCWVNGSNALALDKLSDSQAGQFIIQELARIRPATRNKLAFAYRQSWQNNPYQQGAYAYYRAGTVSKIAPVIAQAQGNIHFAGEHTQPLLPGMEAALYSGMRVADEIKQRI